MPIKLVNFLKFSNEAPFDNAVGKIPGTLEDIGAEFLLYTTKGSDDSESKSPRSVRRRR